MIVIILPLITAFIASVLTTPISIIVSKKFGIFDDPKRHKHPAMIHKKPIPRGGGIPLFLGVLIAGAIFLPLNSTTQALFSAAFIALIVGILDDRLDISPYLRFASNIVVAIIIVISGIDIAFITNPFGGILHLDSINFSIAFIGIKTVIYFSQIATVIWLVWVMNMLNWSKGVDGQMPGIVAISAIAIGILSLRFPSSDINSLIASNLSFMIAGSSLGFLIFNYYPAKIFPGYGATSLYLLLGAVSVLSGAKIATAILVMGVPMVDGLFTVGRRIVSGKSPFWHDKKHLHHILLELGLDQRRISLFYWLISAILGALSLSLTSKGKYFAIIMLVVIVGGTLFFLHLILKLRNEKKPS